MPASFVRRAAGLAALVAAACALAGCGKSGGGATDSVSGKVTVGGSPASGEIVFIGSDAKQYPSPIAPDGKYEIMNAPKGDYKVIFRAMGGAGITMPGAVKDKVEVSAGGGGGTPPPVKYSKPDNGQTVTVTGGKQVDKNFDLTP